MRLVVDAVIEHLPGSANWLAGLSDQEPDLSAIIATEPATSDLKGRTYKVRAGYQKLFEAVGDGKSSGLRKVTAYALTHLPGLSEVYDRSKEVDADQGRPGRPQEYAKPVRAISVSLPQEHIDYLLSKSTDGEISWVLRKIIEGAAEKEGYEFIDH